MQSAQGKGVKALDLAGQKTAAPRAALPSPSVAKDKLSPSSRELLALDLAVSQEALSVPAVTLPRFTNVKNVKDLLRRAEVVRGNLLVDEYGSVYKLGEKFQEGNFGSVRYAQKRDRVVDQQYVAKEIKLGSSKEAQHAANMLKAEIKTVILAKSALAPHAILTTKQSVYILMPVLDGDCFDLIESLEGLDHAMALMPRPSEEGKARARLEIAEPHGPITVGEMRERIAYGSILATLRDLVHLHKAGYAHRDIKPENLMYDRSGEMHLGDYGLASKADKADYVGGTEIYMPLEALSTDHAYAKKYTPRAGDLWGVGATAMMILISKNINQAVLDAPHFNTKKQSSQNALYSMIEDYDRVWDALSLSNPSKVVKVLEEAIEEQNEAAPLLLELYDSSPELFEIIVAMMAPNPTSRPTAERALAALMTVETPGIRDIGKLIRNFDVPGRKTMAKPEPLRAIQDVLETDKLLLRRPTSRGERSSLHMSFYESATRITLEELATPNRPPIKRR